tara:strand:- start:491 stop:664 length:174 start_codon:yes stop_codon:yes gene_type:complete
MNIKTAQYIENSNNEKTVIKVTTQTDKILFVPLDNDNRHYVEILAWVADGNTIEEAD